MPEPVNADVLEAPIPTEARKALDSLSDRIFGTVAEPEAPAEPETPPAKPAKPAQPTPPAPPPDRTQAQPEPAKPTKPAKATPATPDPIAGVLPPDSLMQDGEPAAAAPPEPADEDLWPEEAPTSIKSEKGKADYKAWRASHRAIAQENKDLKAKISQAPQPDAIAKARIQELEGQVGELSKGFARVALMEHPQFIRDFTLPIKQLETAAKKLATDAGLEPGALDRVLTLEGATRIRAMDELAEQIESPTLRRRLERTVEDLEQKEAHRNQVLADSRGNVERLTQQQKSEQYRSLAEQEERIKSTLTGIVDHLGVKQKIPFFQKSEQAGAEKWNEGMDQDEATILELATKSTDQTQLLGALTMGVKFPRVYAAYQAERTARIAAEKALADKRASEPSLGGGGGGQLNGADDQAIKPDDYLPENIASRLNRTRGN